MANQSLDQNLRYVQVEANTAYIDSRVYCQEVIEVHHGDWLQNVLRKHQTVIEQYFGTLRFENGAVLSKNGVLNNTEVYALLTEPQVNFALALSRNTSKTMQRKAELITDHKSRPTTIAKAQSMISA